MEVELLAKDVDTFELETLRSTNGVISKEDAIEAAKQSSLKHLDGELADFIVLIEEDGLERLPVLDVAAVEVIVFLLVFRDEGGNECRYFGVACLCHY